MRIVLDTNVVVSALVFPGGAPEDVYRLVLAEKVAFVTSQPLLAELGRVLVQRFGWEPAYAAEAVTQLVRLSDVVEPDEQMQVIDEDPADDRVLEAAAAGDADVIVGGDRHLRQLGSWRGIRIVAPSEFLAGRG